MSKFNIRERAVLDGCAIVQIIDMIEYESGFGYKVMEIKDKYFHIVQEFRLSKLPKSIEEEVDMGLYDDTSKPQAINTLLRTIGVRPEEIWRGNDGNLYELDPNGNVWVKNTDNQEWSIDDQFLPSILDGTLYPIWEPQEGDVVYVPCFIESNFVTTFKWKGGTPWELKMLKLGLIYKTEEEAEKVAYQMLQVVSCY